MMWTAIPLWRGIYLLCPCALVCFTREHLLNFHRWYGYMQLITHEMRNELSEQAIRQGRLGKLVLKVPGSGILHGHLL